MASDELGGRQPGTDGIEKAAQFIEQAFEDRAEITPVSVDTHVKEAVTEAIHMLDTGRLRVAEKVDGEWIVNQCEKTTFD